MKSPGEGSGATTVLHENKMGGFASSQHRARTLQQQSHVIFIRLGRKTHHYASASAASQDFFQRNF